MRRKKMIVGAVLAGLFFCVNTVLAAAEPDPLVGRWDITIHHKDKARVSWLGVEKKDGKYAGLFLNEGGSPGKLKDVHLDGKTVKWEWRRGDRFHKFTGMLEGDTMKGERVDNNNHKVQWSANRFVRKLNVTGKWILQINQGEKVRTSTLLLKQQGDQITGKMVRQGGKVKKKKGSGLAIEDAALAKDIFSSGITFAVMTDKPREQTYKLRVKGDVLEGVAVNKRGTEIKVTGQRERKWGQPVELFNGKDLDGWKPMSTGRPNNWKVIDGIMSNTGHGANIVNERKFQDFKMHVEFKIPAHSNSGVYLRGRYEIQVEDTYGRGVNPNICGSLYGRLAPSENAAKKAGEWQTFDVTLIDSYVTLVYNGIKTVDNQELVGITGGAIDSDEAAPGPTYLQGDHGAVYYRKITVTPAEPVAVPEGLE